MRLWRPFALRLLCALLLAAPSLRLFGQFALPPEATSAHSHSGQFIVHVERYYGAGQGKSVLQTNANLVRLTPTVLPVSCERIKQLLYKELNLTPGWRGKIFVVLVPAQTPEDPVQLTEGRFRDGWQYRVDLPEIIEPGRFVRALVQVMLKEIANRAQTPQAVEVPSWLADGLSQQILAANKNDILLPSPSRTSDGRVLSAAVVEGVRPDPLKQAHILLAEREPLTFEQLSWPTPSQLNGPDAKQYDASAQLLVYSLTRLKDGRSCLRAFVTGLPSHQNWQFTFLDAFQQHFESLRAVEKWWAVQGVHFTGRELTQTWTPDESWRKLDNALRCGALVQGPTNQSAVRSEVSLQTIISEWDRSRQIGVLRDKLQELTLLQLRLSTNLVPITEEYRSTLSAYLDSCEKGGLPLFKKTARRHAAETALRELTAIDVRREELRGGTNLP